MIWKAQLLITPGARILCFLNDFNQVIICVEDIMGILQAMMYFSAIFGV
jgi:hypothetical protein